MNRKQKYVNNYNNECCPDVSIIVPAYNEEKVIEEKIRNTVALDYPKDKVEILIGSDGSDDKTDEICQRYMDIIRFIQIKPRQGKANVLNTLIPMAKGEIVLFSDANTIFESDSLKKIIPHFKDSSIGGVCGRLVLVGKKDSLESYEETYWKYESDIKNMESKVYSTIGSNGGIYAMRKELFKTIPVDTIIDDFWISLNILEENKRIYFEKDAIAYEYISKNIIDEFWRKVRIGSGNLQTFLRKPVISNQNRWFIHIAFYSHKVIRWLIPFLLISLYLSTVVLSSNSGMVIPFYLFNLFILIALLGIILEIKSRIINSVSYFILFNFALLFGYIRYIFGRQTVLWRRAER